MKKLRGRTGLPLVPDLADANLTNFGQARNIVANDDPYSPFVYVVGAHSDSPDAQQCTGEDFNYVREKFLIVLPLPGRL